MKRAEPNAGHRALARIDPDLLITQNVDGLHERAGSRRVVALHGRIADVVCLSCRAVTARAALHAAAHRAQPGLRRAARAGRGTAGRRRRARRHPRLRRRRLPWLRRRAQAGRGLLRRERPGGPGRALLRRRSTRSPGTDGALLVAGSSLTVMSGFRFVRRAAKAGTPVVIVNRGATRGDDLATYRLDAGTSEFLTALAARAS